MKNTQTVTSILNESFELTTGFKKPIFILSLASFLLVVIGWVFYLTLVVYPRLNTLFELARAQMARGQELTAAQLASMPTISTPISNIIFLYSSFFIIGLVFGFITAMKVLLGVRRSIGLSISISGAFSECLKHVFEIIKLFSLILITFITIQYIINSIFSTHSLTNLLVHLIVSVGAFILMIIVSVFSLPLIILKRYNSIDALKYGTRNFVMNFSSIIPLFFILGMLHTLSILTLGIGLIWTLPMDYAACGIFFRNCYNLKRKAS